MQGFCPTGHDQRDNTQQIAATYRTDVSFNFKNQVLCVLQRKYLR